MKALELVVSCDSGSEASYHATRGGGVAVLLGKSRWRGGRARLPCIWKRGEEEIA